MQAQQLQQPQEQPQGNIMEDGSQQFKFGGYKPKPKPNPSKKANITILEIQKMLQQGASQEDVEMQLEKSGMNADQAEQLTLTAMQQMKGQAQPQQQGIPMDGQQMANGGGIHIKKSHEGRFTAYKKRTGKTTTEALHSKDPHVRQMANFARNAAK
jgi:ribosomal protein S16